jgi:hypothetical protein
MPPKEVTPGLGLDAFSCPHCGAFADQHWFKMFAQSFNRNDKPFVFTTDAFQQTTPKGMEEKDRKAFLQFFKRFKKNEVTYLVHEYGETCHWEMANACLSLCHSCEGWSIWIKDRLAWPAYSIKIEAHPDIPANIKDDFIEAAEIAEKSPRGSAALSRLIVQKLMAILEKPGRISTTILPPW